MLCVIRDLQVLSMARWAINLAKLDGVHEIYRRDLGNWQGSDNEESDSDSDDTETDPDNDEEGGVTLGVPSPTESKEQSVPEVSGASDFEQPEIVMVDTRPQCVSTISYNPVQKTHCPVCHIYSIPSSDRVLKILCSTDMPIAQAYPRAAILTPTPSTGPVHSKHCETSLLGHPRHGRTSFLTTYVRMAM